MTPSQNMNTKFDAILFDLGNVVLRIHFERCFQSWAKSAGKDPQEISKSYVFDQMYALHETADISADRYHAHVCHLIGSNIPYNDFVTGWNSIFGDPISETMELIVELKEHYKIFALTNSNVLHRQVWSEQYKENLKHFERIFCSSQLKLRKPDLAAFEKVCTETGISKDRILFIDDLEANVRGGNESGIRSILFSDPASSIREVRALLSAYSLAPGIPSS